MIIISPKEKMNVISEEVGAVGHILYKDINQVIITKYKEEEQEKSINSPKQKEEKDRINFHFPSKSNKNKNFIKTINPYKSWEKRNTPSASTHHTTVNSFLQSSSCQSDANYIIKNERVVTSADLRSPSKEGIKGLNMNKINTKPFLSIDKNQEKKKGVDWADKAMKSDGRGDRVCLRPTRVSSQERKNPSTKHSQNSLKCFFSVPLQDDSVVELQNNLHALQLDVQIDNMEQNFASLSKNLQRYTCDILDTSQLLLSPIKENIKNSTISTISPLKEKAETKPFQQQNNKFKLEEITNQQIIKDVVGMNEQVYPSLNLYDESNQDFGQDEDEEVSKIFKNEQVSQILPLSECSFLSENDEIKEIESKLNIEGVQKTSTNSYLNVFFDQSHNSITQQLQQQKDFNQDSTIQQPSLIHARAQIKMPPLPIKSGLIPTLNTNIEICKTKKPSFINSKIDQINSVNTSKSCLNIIRNKKLHNNSSSLIRKRLEIQDNQYYYIDNVEKDEKQTLEMKKKSENQGILLENKFVSKKLIKNSESCGYPLIDNSLNHYLSLPREKKNNLPLINS